LELPHFLRPNEMRSEMTGEPQDVLCALKMTLHFLEYWVFAHHTKGAPDPRYLFQERFSDNVLSV